MTALKQEKFGDTAADYYLDITDQICPMTFVRTKLLIERMAGGETAAVRLTGEEPLGNVPRSVKEYGHEVLSLEPEPGETPGSGIHILVLRKA